MRSGNDKERGVYRKFKVTRTDGSHKKGGKHHECSYFVLDLEHDLLRGGAAEANVHRVTFQQAVAAGAPMVMTAHLSVPEWDERPATLSPVALKTWLRRRLGFDGVIITDDLEMGAISQRMPVPQGAGQALAAGADLLLICNNYQAAWDAAATLGQDAGLALRGLEAAARLHCLRVRVNSEPADLATVKEYFFSHR